MARLTDDAQWIVLMGFIVSFSLFFLAIVINQSTVIGQTTAESVSEFPKNDIRSVRDVIVQDAYLGNTFQERDNVRYDIQAIALQRQNAVVWFENTTYSTSTDNFVTGEIRFNNGVTLYRESWTYRE